MRAATEVSPAMASRRFGRFELRPGERALFADGAPVALGARAFDLLVALTERPGSLITKDDLLATVWQGLVVEENNLQVQVSTLRKILGQSALATIPGRGYRFNVPVVSADAAPAALVDSSHEEVADASRDTSTSSPRGNLPARMPRLFGRSEDLDAIVALLREHPVVTITGPGGIGKTQIAHAAALRVANEHRESYPDGLWWIELAALTDGALVPAAVAQAMGVRLAGDRPTALVLRSQLAAKRALLVLDNCEHVAEAVAAFVDTVMASASRVTILVTSQETLRAADEHVYRLGALAVPDAADVESAAHFGALELFEARAQAVDPRFALSGANTPAVIEICRRLDGIPLAIELAAARLPLLGVEGLRARLDERFNLLTAGARVVLRRHQTLRATLEWSHSLLTPDERTVFRRLAIFAGGFTLEGAQHVASDEAIDRWTALDHLGALVDKSLVLAEGDPIPRYRMLETTRAYGLERLAESGETQQVLLRHAQAVLAVLEPFVLDEWQWRATGAFVPAARAEVDNLRAALDWATASAETRVVAIALAGASYCVWWSASNMAEGLARCLGLRRFVDESVPTQVAAQFWDVTSKLALYSFRREGFDAAVRAAQLYRELGDDQRRFDALTLGTAQGARFATVDEMEAGIAEAAQLVRPEWPARQRSSLEFARCWWFARQGGIEEALAAAERQAAICRDGGAEAASLYAVSNITTMELLLGRWHDTLAHARTAIDRLHALGADAGASHLYQSEMLALVMLGRLDEAWVAARNAYPRLLHEGDEYRLLLSLALLNAREGRLDVAMRIVGFDDALRSRIGDAVNIFAPIYRKELDPLLASLTQDERTRLTAEGAALSDDEVFRLAYGGAV
ncbi:MAG TPA: winged helix-turn-helix domain-containing protein [Casimicrobiaceae bacterium]|nr:winged helix-turn-helix domain-containing protein [Casimicrobiaceae bacterium]